MATKGSSKGSLTHRRPSRLTVIGPKPADHEGEDVATALSAYREVSPAARAIVRENAWALDAASKLPSLVSGLFGDHAYSELSVDEDLPERLLVTIHTGVAIKSWRETYRGLLRAWSESADPEARRKVLFSVESA